MGEDAHEKWSSHRPEEAVVVATIWKGRARSRKRIEKPRMSRNRCDDVSVRVSAVNEHRPMAQNCTTDLAKSINRKD